MLTLPPTALVDHGTGAPPGAASDLTVSLLHRPLIVLTEPVKTSLEAESATNGIFSVARLVLRPATSP